MRKLYPQLSEKNPLIHHSKAFLWVQRTVEVFLISHYIIHESTYTHLHVSQRQDRTMEWTDRRKERTWTARTECCEIWLSLLSQLLIVFKINSLVIYGWGDYWWFTKNSGCQNMSDSYMYIVRIWGIHFSEDSCVRHTQRFAIRTWPQTKVQNYTFQLRFGQLFRG